MKSFISKAVVKALKFILVSSADPRKASLTVRAFTLGLIPYAMQATGLVCQLGYTCIDITPTLADQIVNWATNGVFYVTLIISLVGTTFGLFRKFDLTIKGQNKAIQ